jgi:DNA-3-methyladenine glycosylase
VARLKLPFFLQSDVVSVGRQLLGKHLFTRIDGGPLTGGIIVEAEAYAGPEDWASHAHGNRRTPRTEVMYARGGVAYVYLCYGIHSLFNVITNEAEVPHAVLIRAIEPTHGLETMLERRRMNALARNLAAGPGALSQALGIRCGHSGLSLLGREIWLEDRGARVPPRAIVAGPRVGVGYAGADAKRPWRFRIRGSPWTSRAS